MRFEELASWPKVPLKGSRLHGPVADPPASIDDQMVLLGLVQATSWIMPFLGKPQDLLFIQS